MKRFLLSLVALVITSVCFAQDIIVKKDGSTIVAKVLEIGSTEVKYTLHNNSDKNTHTISISELLSINYENGDKDVFGNSVNNAQKQTEQPSVIITNPNNQTYNVSLNNQLLAERKLNTANRLKFWSWVTIGVSSFCLVCSGVAFANSGRISKEGPGSHIAEALIGLGVATGGYFMMKKAKSLKKEARELLSCSIIEKEIKVGDLALCPNVVLLSNPNGNYDKSIGMGLKVKF